MSPRSTLARLSWVFVLSAAALLGCSVTPLGATEAGIAKARSAAAPGAELFDRECSSCHGKQGEGLTTAPAIMGPGALRTFSRDDSSSSSPSYSVNAQAPIDVAHVPGQAKRPPFRTAQDVYDYVSTRMPMPRSRAGTLKPEDYWAIVNFMLIAHGAPVPASGLSEANAKSVELPH